MGRCWLQRETLFPSSPSPSFTANKFHRSHWDGFLSSFSSPPSSSSADILPVTEAPVSGSRYWISHTHTHTSELLIEWIRYSWLVEHLYILKQGASSGYCVSARSRHRLSSWFTSAEPQQPTTGVIPRRHPPVCQRESLSPLMLFIPTKPVFELGVCVIFKTLSGASPLLRGVLCVLGLCSLSYVVNYSWPMKTPAPLPLPSETRIIWITSSSDVCVCVRGESRGEGVKRSPPHLPPSHLRLEWKASKWCVCVRAHRRACVFSSSPPLSLFPPYFSAHQSHDWKTHL